MSALAFAQISARLRGSARTVEPIVNANQLMMIAEQAATLKQLAEAAYEREAFKPNLTHAEADQRIATLTAKLKLLGDPPHTL